MTTNNVVPVNGMLQTLPREVFAQVLLHLPARDVCAVAQTSRFASNASRRQAILTFCCCGSDHRARLTDVGARARRNASFFAAFWRAMLERDAATWAAFSSSAAERPATAATESKKSKGEVRWRRLGALFRGFLAESERERGHDDSDSNSDDNGVEMPVLSGGRRRASAQPQLTTPWSNASWYACYVHQFVANRRAQRALVAQSPPAMTHMKGGDGRSASRSLFAEWAGVPSGTYRIPLFGLGRSGKSAKVR